MLESQEGVCIKLLIWNNNWWAPRALDDVLSSYDGIEVEVLHSLYNIGGFGRFYAARKLSEDYPAVIFIDDDQSASNEAIRTLWEERAETRISSWWAFNFEGTERYLDRKEAAPGESAEYCGTGGMVCPTFVFEEDALFNKCPRKFWFIEDLWLSYFADHCLSLELKKSHARFWVKDDGKNQVDRIYPLKDDFLHELIDRGWNSPGPG